MDSFVFCAIFFVFKSCVKILNVSEIAICQVIFINLLNTKFSVKMTAAFKNILFSMVQGNIFH